MTTPTVSAELPEALRLANEISKAGAFPAYPRAPYEAAAAELRRLHAQVAALTAAPQGAAYAALPEKYYLAGGEVPTWDAKQMHAFADATHALRTTPVQNPAEIEHVACDVSKNGAEVNMSSQQTAPAGFVPVAAFDRLYAHAESLAAQLLATPQRDVQEPCGWIYDWTHSSATGKPDTTYTGFTKDEAHARKHDNCIAVFTTQQPTQPQARPISGAKSFQTYAEANAYSKGYYAGKKAAKQAQAGAVPLTCEWAHNENDGGFWESACGEAWRFDDGGPAENRMHFCHSCGKSLRIKGKEAGSAYVGGIKGGLHGAK